MINVEQWSNVCGDVIGMVFFSKQRDTDVFWAHVYHRYRCDFLDLTIVVDVFRCFSYSRFLVGFLDFFGILFNAHARKVKDCSLTPLIYICQSSFFCRGLFLLKMFGEFCLSEFINSRGTLVSCPCPLSE